MTTYSGGVKGFHLGLALGRGRFGLIAAQGRKLRWVQLGFDLGREGRQGTEDRLAQVLAARPQQRVSAANAFSTHHGRGAENAEVRSEANAIALLIVKELQLQDLRARFTLTPTLSHEYAGEGAGMLCIAPSPAKGHEGAPRGPWRGLGAKQGFRAACGEPAQRSGLASPDAHCKCGCSRAAVTFLKRLRGRRASQRRKIN